LLKDVITKTIDITLCVVGVDFQVNNGRLDHDDSTLPELDIISFALRQVSPNNISQILGDPSSCGKLEQSAELIRSSCSSQSYSKQQSENNLKDSTTCLFAAFLSQVVFGPSIGSSEIIRVKRCGTIVDDVFCITTSCFVDPDHPNKVYRWFKALFGLHHALRLVMLLYQLPREAGYKRGTIDKTFIPLKNIMLQSHHGDKDASDKAMWTLLMRESPFDLEAFSDSDYGGSNLDRKSTTGGCQFLGQRLISWQCKKQTIVATSTTEAEYVAAANCCGQVLWVQNQLLDYGFNFMNTKIHIDNESTICIVKNPVYHSKTKHIEIRHHFIRDCYEKKLISVEKIHTDLNVADLLTKPFDGPRFNYLVVSIGFAEIVDFLRGSNLRYALTTNPTIYDSLVKQFWQTATANTNTDGTLDIVHTGDTKGQEHAAQAQTQPIPPPPPIPSTTPTPIPTSTPPPPPIPSTTPTPIPTSTPPPPPIPSTTPPPIPSTKPQPIPTPTSPPPPPPETEPSTDEHIYEEQSPVHHHFSPSQAQAPSHMPTDDLLQTVPN
ncbi:hypothetical protein Tco_0661178, partial [Tanacetum coccineum]